MPAVNSKQGQSKGKECDQQIISTKIYYTKRFRIGAIKDESKEIFYSNWRQIKLFCFYQTQKTLLLTKD